MIEMRGKRYAIDSDKLLKETDVYYLANVGKISSELIKAQLKENKLSYYAFTALEDGGFDIRKYWIKDSNINTVRIKADELQVLLEQTKYKKIARKLDGFLNIRQFKPLVSYMNFCDAAKLSYLTFINDDDYKDYLEKKESSQLSQEDYGIVHTDKPLAYIKKRAKDISCIPAIKVHWNEELYGDDYKCLVGVLSHTIDEQYSVHPIISKYATSLYEDMLTALYVSFVELSLGISINKPTYASYLTLPIIINVISHALINASA